jgi:hypothetical protein
MMWRFSIESLTALVSQSIKCNQKSGVYFDEIPIIIITQCGIYSIALLVQRLLLPAQIKYAVSWFRSPLSKAHYIPTVEFAALCAVTLQWLQPQQRMSK